jgi:hypothetical protein
LDDCLQPFGIQAPDAAEDTIDKTGFSRRHNCLTNSTKVHESFCHTIKKEPPWRRNN